MLCYCCQVHNFTSRHPISPFFTSWLANVRRNVPRLLPSCSYDWLGRERNDANQRQEAVIPAFKRPVMYRRIVVMVTHKWTATLAAWLWALSPHIQHNAFDQRRHVAATTEKTQLKSHDGSDCYQLSKGNKDRVSDCKCLCKMAAH